MAHWKLRRTGSGGGIEPISDDATVPLPAVLRRHRGAEADDIGLPALRLLAALVWHAWGTMRSSPRRRHLVAVDVLRRYAFLGAGHTSTDGLRKALRELVDGGFAAIAADGRRDAPSDPPILLHLPQDLSLRGRAVTFSLSASGEQFFGLTEKSSRFVIVPMAVLRAVGSVFAARLCLWLLAYPRRRTKAFTVAPGDLCDALGVPAGGSSYRKNFAALRSRVITPAVEALARHAGVEVRCETVRSGGGRGRVHEITFTAAEIGLGTPSGTGAHSRQGGAAAFDGPARSGDHHGDRDAMDGDEPVSDDDRDAIDGDDRFPDDGYIHAPDEDDEDDERPSWW